MKYKLLILFFTCSICCVHGQKSEIDLIPSKKKPEFKYGSLLIPTFLIGYGIIGLESNELKHINKEIKRSFNNDNTNNYTFNNNEFAIDDISQYVPFLSVYGLNSFGVLGKNNSKDRSIILGTAYVTMLSTVYSLKAITKVPRPDGSSNRSFPSGHTATAFMGAEFLYQEYKDVSIWYGIGGYLIAGGTGYFRMYNNKHWLTDIAAGAGIGILSTKFAYWIHPFLKKYIFEDKKNVDGIVVPFFNGREYGIGFTLMF